MLKSITKKSIALIMVLLTILSAFSNFTYATEISSAYVQNGGDIDSDEYVPMDDNNVKDLYVITTARKRDTKE